MRRRAATPAAGRLCAAAIVWSVAATIAACTAPRETEPLRGPLPALEPGLGRIVFYRPDNAFLGVLTPDIVVNGRTVGEAIVGSVFYRTAWPGEYTVFLAGREDEAVVFTLAPEATRYVRIGPRFVLTDSRLVLSLVDPATGQAQVQGLLHRGEAH